MVSCRSFVAKLLVVCNFCVSCCIISRDLFRNRVCSNCTYSFGIVFGIMGFAGD